MTDSGRPTPTPEQRAVVDAALRGESFKVAAFAGTGKTTSLTETARALPERRILYLVFNKAQQRAAQARFASLAASGSHVRVEARTAHGIAWKLFGANRYSGRIGAREHEIAGAWTSYLRAGMLAHLPLEEGRVAARRAIEALRAFLASDDERIGPVHARADASDAVIDAARDLWSRLDGSGAEPLPVTHDVYLKAWQLSHPRLPWCETLMYDEAQDATPAMLAIVRDQSDLQSIYVGDEHQQIYEFRGAVNALGSLALPTYALTETWRFGEKISAAANAVLAAKGERLRIRPGRACADATRFGYPDRCDLVLARTNAGLIEEALRLGEQGAKVYVRGATRAETGVSGNGYGEIVGKLLAAYDLRQGKPTSHPSFAEFASWDDLSSAAEDGGAEHLRQFVRLVETHGKDVPFVAKRLRESCVSDAAKADAVLSTVHRFKGEEATTVALAGDYRRFAYRDHETQRDAIDAGEANLAYVAMTRARETLWTGGALRILEESFAQAAVPSPFAGAPDAARSRTAAPTAAVPRQEILEGGRYRHPKFGVLTVLSADASVIVARTESGTTRNLAPGYVRMEAL